MEVSSIRLLPNPPKGEVCAVHLRVFQEEPLSQVQMEGSGFRNPLKASPLFRSYRAELACRKNFFHCLLYRALKLRNQTATG